MGFDHSASADVDVSAVRHVTLEVPNLAAEKLLLSQVRAQLQQSFAPPMQVGNEVPLAINSCGRARLVSVNALTGVVSKVHEIPVTAFVEGEDNEVFGTWNRLVAYQPTLQQIKVIQGHGGEIVPGILSDHIEAMRESATSGRPRPVQLDIDPTMVCPSHCLFCFSASYRKTRGSSMRLSDSLLFATLRSWIDFGVKVVRFDGGGDPLAHPKCIDAIEYAASRGVRTALLTSGDALHRKSLDRLVAAQTYVRISVNAASDQVREQIHLSYGGKQSARTLYKLMRQLAELRRDEYGIRARAQMPLGATFMVHPLNIGEIDQAAKQTAEAGFDHISFRVILGKAHAVNFSPYLSKLAEEGFKKAAARANNEFRVFTPTRPLKDTGYAPSNHFPRCISSTHRVLVEVGRSADEAAIVPCGRYRGHGFTAGEAIPPDVLARTNAHTEIVDIWRSERISNIVARYPESCGDCIDRSANVMFNGMFDALKKDPMTVFFRATVSDR